MLLLFRDFVDRSPQALDLRLLFRLIRLPKPAELLDMRLLTSNLSPDLFKLRAAVCHRRPQTCDI
jgi:hypothetical protein